ncbi:MAG: glycosyltransferase family 2 protein [Dehalococcoidia bacterium]|nr:glycosyltransferase family 2 protein [Dehalococcoidia bacterium]
MNKFAISVVVPAYNEEQYISSCLAAIRNQDFRGSYEIIVVDNSSEDRTAEIARSFGARVLTETRRTAAAARQTGFAEARGDIIATTDADTVVPSNWLSHIYRAFQVTPGLVAFGGLHNSLDDCPFLPRFALKYGLAPIWTTYGLFIGHRPLFGVNMAVKREAFVAAGGFNPVVTQGEDADIALRLLEHGRVMLDCRFRVATSGRRFRRGLFPGVLSYLPYDFRGEWRVGRLLLIPSSGNGSGNGGGPVAFAQTVVAVARIIRGLSRGREMLLRVREGDDVPPWMRRGESKG